MQTHTEQLSESTANLLSVVNSELVFSDMLISADEPVMIRNAAGWSQFPDVTYSADDIAWILSQMEPQWESELLKGGFSRPFVTGSWRLRITAYLAMRGEKQMLAIRRTPVDPVSLSDAGLPPTIRLMVDNPSGLVLIAGATGAGKSTTVAALVDYLNTERNIHIETIEDPIEIVFKAKKAIFSQREVGPDVPTFSEGVRGAMRQRPDVIVIGEIRDQETAQAALMAGESGHLVMATLHASSAYGAIQKLLSFFPGDEASKIATLATSLMGVIYQVMVPAAADKVSGVVATELLFNHDQKFSEILGDAVKVNAELANGQKTNSSISRTLAQLIKTEKITKANAMRAVAGNGKAMRELETLIASR